MSEADTCRELITPAIVAAGWDAEPHAIVEQYSFTDGRIVVTGNKAKRQPQKRADYLLRYTNDIPIAVVEAKDQAGYAPGDGLQQAKDYASILGLKFAYSSNGKGIVEYDFFTGKEQVVVAFPTPKQLWDRWKAGETVVGVSSEKVEKGILEPYYHMNGKSPRYYQQIAINRAVQAVLQGQKRVLLTLATGTGKTIVAFNICWKLWKAGWNKRGDFQKPKILFLADRNVLVDDPKDLTFRPFDQARHKIENGEVVKSREMYFATYQSLAKDERRPGLYKEYAPDFFDLVVIDECHRGSAKDESNWREILEYFQPAYQIGMTATPKKEENANTYSYFGEPIYTYSLRQGIEDGFLAPYKVHRVVTSWDEEGYQPLEGELDKFGNALPDRDFGTADFDRKLVIDRRTMEIAIHLTNYLKKSDRYAKTIVFCVDQDHALRMREALSNLNADIVKNHSNYVQRITSNERYCDAYLDDFKDVEKIYPVIATTSQLLTTGVDIPTCKNVVLVRSINSMTEFKQIIGRGTRVKEDYDKLYFTILDYTGATRLFRDPDFDGVPEVDTTETTEDNSDGGENIIVESDLNGKTDPPIGNEPRKYYVEGGAGGIAHEMIQQLSFDGGLHVVEITMKAGEVTRKLYQSGEELRKHWADPTQRAELTESLSANGIDFKVLADLMDEPEADPLDLLCHLAFNSPVQTRKARANRLRKEQRQFFEKYTPAAQQVLEDILEKYSSYGVSEFVVPDVLKVPPISQRGRLHELIRMFGGADKLKEAVVEMQQLLYAA
ncbi:MAG: DEAD/DEAH box helicase family protein [Chloroflexi bacterium]|jgi:type I restriction enzyme R subunit|nr:DEAD/DEAH box helicase family protein [Chloroflexota bacterium]OJV95047.1 MAG: DEAD/DEAH box helicase [Chloroflexi bacterium 54-19]